MSKPVVHILATVRNPELLPAALLVFQTLRVGFPTALVCVWGNGLAPAHAAAVAKAAAANDCAFQNIPATSHDAWIEHALNNHAGPFWICDTDVVFFESVENFYTAADGDLFAGRFEPEFMDPWTKTIHAERLHTCVMWFNAPLLRAHLRAWMEQFPPPWGRTAQYPLLRQTFIPRRGLPWKAELTDTTAGLWQAGMGTPFSHHENAAFEHLCAATYVDELNSSLGFDLQQAHRAVYANHELARGIQHKQTAWYAANAVKRPVAVPTMTKTTRPKLSDDELVQLSHYSREQLLTFLKMVEGGDGLEIGAWKGESTVWFLLNGISTMTVIEPFTGNPEHHVDPAALRRAFNQTIRRYRPRIEVIKQRSATALPVLQVSGTQFDFIYVDGSHDSRDVMTDAMLGWQLLKPGGILVFDDYGWNLNADQYRNPAPAIDFFLAAHAGELVVCHQGYQVVVQKLTVQTSEPVLKEASNVSI